MILGSDHLKKHIPNKEKKLRPIMSVEELNFEVET